MLDITNASRYLTDLSESLVYDASVMWTIWNVTEFGGELKPVPVIPTNYQNADFFFPNNNMLTVWGYFSPAHNLPTESDVYIAINTPLLAEVSSKRGQTFYHNVADTLLHEMVHQWCHQNGIDDTGQDGSHNETFRDAARKHGLSCRKGCEGWNRTEVHKGHWRPFYALASDIDHASGGNLTHKMRSTHIAPIVEERRAS